jgi:hypothetical protein
MRTVCVAVLLDDVHHLVGDLLTARARRHAHIRNKRTPLIPRVELNISINVGAVVSVVGSCTRSQQTRAPHPPG